MRTADVNGAMRNGATDLNPATGETVSADSMASATPSTAQNPPTQPGMGHHTARGFMWMLSQTLATKAITTVGQFLLLAVLAPEDIGVVGIAYAMSIIPVLVQQGGIRQVLVQRGRHFTRWANPAFWLSITLGCIGALLMVLLVPVARYLYDEPRLPQLMLLVALMFPLDSLNIVPMAQMQTELRFRLVAAIAFVQNSGQIVISLVLALMQWGPYSLVVSRIIVLIGVAVMAWVTAPVKLRPYPQARRFRFLLADGWLVVAVNSTNLFNTYVPNLVLGGSAKVVGFYSTAYALSLQAMVLFTENLGGVLLPVLSKLRDEPERQAEGFIRAAKLMASLGIFACLLQVPMAGPLLHALFGDKWNSSILIIQILSIGMALKTIGAPANSLLYAQGRFKAEALYSAASALTFVALVAIGARLAERQAEGVAIAAAVHMLITEPLHLYVAVRPTGKRWTAVLRTFAVPLALSIVSIGAGMACERLIPQVRGRDWWALIVIGLVSAGLYFPLLRLCLPSVWNDGRARAMALLGR